ncbi:cupin [Amycolatopsis antarctica]|uniref:Cupin n=1 Tax=Amycolatopsis antarctica TaxID=1854586 RepID=A0A263CV38_9PSEU|nr:cupin domain-containing protein [Amycolatopsis antarctica]OZM69980.1 cupin [Amycolatopsis antarctica]
MTLLAASAAATFENDGFTFRSLAVPSRGTTELAVWTLEVAPGAVSERHTVSREEVFLLHAGEIVAEIGGVEYRPGPGDAVILPPDTPGRLANHGGTTARLTVCTSRGIRGTIGETTIDPPWAR